MRLYAALKVVLEAVADPGESSEDDEADALLDLFVAGPGDV